MIRIGRVGWLALVLALAAAGCSDDDSHGNPDATADAADVPVDTAPELTEDDAGRPDEPIGPDDYPPGPYGVAVGDRLENLRFLDIEGRELDLADLHADRTVKLLWIYATAGWCTVCGTESAALPALWTTYHPQGLQILAAVFEDAAGNPAGVSYARSYATRNRFEFPTVADEPFVLGRYFDKAATPMNMLVDLTDMEILDIVMGWDASGLESSVERHLGAIPDRG